MRSKRPGGKNGIKNGGWQFQHIGSFIIMVLVVVEIISVVADVVIVAVLVNVVWMVVVVVVAFS